MKFAFREIAHDLEIADNETLKGAYIPMKAFKDNFYPGRVWSPRQEDNDMRRMRI